MPAAHGLAAHISRTRTSQYNVTGGGFMSKCLAYAAVVRQPYKRASAPIVSSKIFHHLIKGYCKGLIVRNYVGCKLNHFQVVKIQIQVFWRMLNYTFCLEGICGERGDNLYKVLSFVYSFFLQLIMANLMSKYRRWDKKNEHAK